MRIQAKRMAVCSMMTALCVVLMLLGGILELGMYACPMFAGLCLIPVGQNYGKKYQILVYLATGLLCLMLVPSMEENLMFVGLLGWYPMVRQAITRLPGLLRLPLKLIVFNASVLAIEWVVISLFVPEVLTAPMIAVLLVMGNITFLAYDFLIPRMEILMLRLKRLF